MTNLPKLSPIEREILALLAANGPMYGLEMVQASEKLKRGTIYVMLSRMEDKGWIASSQDAIHPYPGLPRRRYVVRGEGQRVLRDTEYLEAILAKGYGAFSA